MPVSCTSPRMFRTGNGSATLLLVPGTRGSSTDCIGIVYVARVPRRGSQTFECPISVPGVYTKCMNMIACLLLLYGVLLLALSWYIQYVVMCLVLNTHHKVLHPVFHFSQASFPTPLRTHPQEEGNNETKTKHRKQNNCCQLATGHTAQATNSSRKRLIHKK